MRTRRKLLIGVAGLGGAIALVTTHLRDQEPRYNDRTLSDWLKDFGPTANPKPEEVQLSGEAEVAIRHIGTNALPFLLEWIAYEPHPSKPGQAIASLLTRVRCIKRPSVIGRWVYGDEKQYALAESTPRAFLVLGECASPAVPALTRLLTDSPNHGHAPRVAEALAKIGPTAMPGLITVLTNSNPGARFWAATAIGFLGTNATPAVPALIRCLTNQATASAAASALGRLKLEPQLVVPELARMTRDFDPIIRSSALVALIDFGHEAWPAIPVLREALRDPDPTVRDYATNALLRLAPEVLTTGE